MAETGIVRFPGSLDPRAQEFKPRNNLLTQQLPVFGPLPPPQQVYYPYAHQAVPFNDAGMLGLGLGYQHHEQQLLHHPQVASPPAYVSVVPPLPPPSAVPTRTLVLSSVPSEASESMIRRELEVFGEVRGVQMERIGDGIVTVHFYDLRHAEKALKEIREQHMQEQTRLRNLFTAFAAENNSGCERDGLIAPPPPPPARGLIAGRAVWAQFIPPSCNAVPDGHNQGTIVVFNLDPDMSTSCLKEVFQPFGAVKEFRETPLKKQQRFVEFYDVRDAAKALGEMNGKEINSKEVVIEFSRPGGHGRKFFNTNTTPLGVYSTSNHHAKMSKFASPPLQPLRPPPPPSPPPPPPPPSRSFSSRSPPNIPLRAHLAHTQSSTAKKLSNSNKANPNEGTYMKGSCSVEDSVGCLSSNSALAGDGILQEVVDGPAKRNPKKGQNSQSSTTSTKHHRHKSSKPWKSRQGKKLDTRFLINEDAMVESNCLDCRTTLMIKNIPNKYSQKLLLNMLDNHCIHCNEQIADGGDDQPLSSYDFVYLPIDFNNKCNVGYGFVNMTSPPAAWRLYKAFHHQHWEVFNSRKICEVTYARVQGLEALKEHFRNSKFPCEMDHYLPVVFSPPRDGGQLTEPLPIVGHKQAQPIINLSLHCPIKSTTDHEVDGGDDSLRNSNNDTDQEEEEEKVIISSSPNGGGNRGEDDKDSSSGSIVT